MGVFLMAGMFAGCALGLVVAAILAGVGIIAAVKIAKSRRHVWGIFAAIFTIVLTLCILAIHGYPYGTVRPGSDYDVAMKNLFLQGFFYCASPGPAALMAALIALLAPRKAANRAVDPDMEILP